jgi:hypothetical protein
MDMIGRRVAGRTCRAARAPTRNDLGSEKRESRTPINFFLSNEILCLMDENEGWASAGLGGPLGHSSGLISACKPLRLALRRPAE